MRTFSVATVCRSEKQRARCGFSHTHTHTCIVLYCIILTRLSIVLYIHQTLLSRVFVMFVDVGTVHSGVCVRIAVEFEGKIGTHTHSNMTALFFVSFIVWCGMDDVIN